MVETDGLLYNVLVHDNTVKEGSAAVVLDEHAAAIHVTAPGEGAQNRRYGKDNQYDKRRGDLGVGECL